MSQLYPLRFQPIFRRYLWGGRRLSSELGKPIGPESDYAESWEIVDRDVDQSTVLDGPLQGTTLRQLMNEHRKPMMGRHHDYSQFPLLFKFLDAQRDLSLQVHPNDRQARTLDPPDLGKTEAWIVLAAEPGSRIYAGLQPEVDEQALRNALLQSEPETVLHWFEPIAGDCVFVPAGTVHALGAGLLVAEIQQASDTTFRLHDWNRTGPDGRPRQLHLEQGLAVADYAAGPVQPRRSTGPSQSTERLVDCDKFVVDRWSFDDQRTIGGDDRFHLIVVLQGAVDLPGWPASDASAFLSSGQSGLLPAGLGTTELRPRERTTMLAICLP